MPLPTLLWAVRRRYAVRRMRFGGIWRIPRSLALAQNRRMPPQQILTPIPFGQPTEARVLRKIRALPLLRLLLTPLAQAERTLSLLLGEARPAPSPHGSFLCLLPSQFLMARSGRLILIMFKP